MGIIQKGRKREWNRRNIGRLCHRWEELVRQFVAIAMMRWEQKGWDQIRPDLSGGAMLAVGGKGPALLGALLSIPARRAVLATPTAEPAAGGNSPGAARANTPGGEIENVVVLSGHMLEPCDVK